MKCLRSQSTHHRFLCRSLAVLTAFGPSVTVLGQPPVGAQPASARADAFNLQYAVPSAAVIVVARPQAILASGAVELFPTEVLQAAAIQEMGVDPLACEQLVVSVAPPMQGPPAYSVYARFAQPIDLAAGKDLADMERAELDGKAYFKSARPDPMDPGFLALDDKSLIAAPDFVMANLLRGADKAGGNPLFKKLAAADKGDDLVALVDAAMIRPFILMALAQADLPPEAQPLLQIPNLVKLIEVRINISRPVDSELLVTANDEDAAVELIKLFDEAKTQIIAKIRQQMQRDRASGDPVKEAGVRYGERMIKLFDQRLELVREGESIVIARGNMAERHSASWTIASTGILLALLLPAVQAAREAARRNASMNNMKQLVLGLANHEASRKAFPAHTSYDADGKPLLSWRVHILPFVEQSTLYKQFHLDEPWDSEHNKQLIAQMPNLFLDPSSIKLSPQDGKTHYLGVLGDAYLFDGTNEGRAFAEIRDGSSNTIAIIQVDDDHAAVWTKPDDWQPDADDPLQGLGGLHPGGTLAGFCDGHVQFISKMIDPETLLSLLTVAGGEDVSNP
jgi:hypothetical protein